MAETLVSPGVLARENDQSFITQQPVEVGAAIIGPTVKGPVETPTIVTSYSDYQNRFGTTIQSGSEFYTYLTSIAAYNYFNNGGNTLLVARTVPNAGTWSYASSSVFANTTVGDATSTGSISLALAGASVFGTTVDDEVKFEYAGTTYRFVAADPAGGLPADQAPLYFVATGSTSAAFATLLQTKMQTVTAVTSILTTADAGSGVLNFTAASAGAYANGITFVTGSSSTFSTGSDGTSPSVLGGGTNTTTNTLCFTLEAIDKGQIWNNSGSMLSQDALASGSIDNVRWEIATSNTSSGTFSLLVRRGDDNQNNKVILESYNNLSLDPNQDNYIEKVIGNTYFNYNSVQDYMEITGSYPNASRYIRVKSVATPTPNYFNNAGIAKDIYTGSIPTIGSGSEGGAFTGGAGNMVAGQVAKFYDAIDTNTQGCVASDYTSMVALLANQDDYKFNVLLTPGLIQGVSAHTSIITTALNNTQGRGDSIYVIDPVSYGSTIAATVTQADSRNTSYAAMYWPWLQTIDPDLGKTVWVPASTMIGGVYAYNDSVSEPWFAPAGINRGGLTNVIRPERKLSQSNRDTLYEGNVNPIATFPGTGTVVYGQKTLQKQASALDRVNVRRLLIALKSYIGQVALNLVFEQNTAATRNNFLAAVNPYLESVQQRQGLYAFKVVMDDSNNTPDVIDRNQMVGAIYLQPTRTAEFIILDFNVLPTGATFPA
jgi:hypothetical protein